jgi:hypothetical protein
VIPDCAACTAAGVKIIDGIANAAVKSAYLALNRKFIGRT